MFRRLRTLRGIAATLILVTYVLAGALHGVYDLDVTNPAGNGTVALHAPADFDTSGKAMVAEHHCHGCFSVSLPTSALLASAIDFELASPAQPRSIGPDRIPGIDTPPPKYLT